MNPTEFPYYEHTDLPAVYLNGINPESLTYPFDKKFIKQKRFKDMLVNENQCFIASTQMKKPVFRFQLGREIDIVNPYDYNTRAVCCGYLEYYFRGFNMIGYLFQYI